MPLITDTDSLHALVRRLKQAPYITVDTEFMRDSTYWPLLCLVQIADGQGAHAVDPLAEGLDMAPFYELMFDRDVLKVFHACRQDVEIVFHATGRLPEPVFDTQVAAMVAGFGDSPGYEALVGKIAGASVDKSARFTDWSRRPLSERQVEYALGDVTHLRTVYEVLVARLRETGREGWVKEEMAILTDPATYRLEPEEAWRRIKTRTHQPRFIARIQALARWREEQAQERNVPRNRIARDEVLLEIAGNPPKEPEGLSAVRGLSKGFHNSAQGRALWQALEAAEALDERDLPKVRKTDRKHERTPPVAELLKVLLRIRCAESGVAPRLVASSDDIDAIARDDRAPVKALEGWRLELFGRDALGIKHGSLALSAGGEEVEIVEIEG